MVLLRGVLLFMSIEKNSRDANTISSEKLLELISAKCGISVKDLNSTHRICKCPICCGRALSKKVKSSVDNMQEYYCISCGDYSLYREADIFLTEDIDEYMYMNVLYSIDDYDLELLRDVLKQYLNSNEKNKWTKSIRFCEKK